MNNESTGSVESTGKELQNITVSMHDVLAKNWATLEAAEEAFVKSNMVTEYALLMNALAAWQIAEKKLYQPKFRTLEQYLEGVKDRLGVSRAYFFERTRIAEAYMQYRDQLYASGFREERDASNLRLFFKAQKTHGTDAAIRQLPKLSYRDYQRWINGTLGGSDGVETAEDRIEITKDGIRFGGELVISAQQIAKIYQGGETPFVIGVRDDAEKRAVSRYLRARREKHADQV